MSRAGTRIGASSGGCGERAHERRAFPVVDQRADERPLLLAYVVDKQARGSTFALDHDGADVAVGEEEDGSLDGDVVVRLVGDDALRFLDVLVVHRAHDASIAIIRPAKASRS